MPMIITVPSGRWKRRRREKEGKHITVKSCGLTHNRNHNAPLAHTFVPRGDSLPLPVTILLERRPFEFVSWHDSLLIAPSHLLSAILGSGLHIPKCRNGWTSWRVASAIASRNRSRLPFDSLRKREFYYRDNLLFLCIGGFSADQKIDFPGTLAYPVKLSQNGWFEQNFFNYCAFTEDKILFQWLIFNLIIRWRLT